MRRPPIRTGQPQRSAVRCARAAFSSAAPPPQRQRASARLRRVTRGACLALEAVDVAGTSHHGRAPKERGLSPAQRPRIGYGPTLASAAQRAHRKLACCASFPETVSACAGAARETQRWLGVGDRSWHVASRSRVEGERPLAGAAPSCRLWPTLASAAQCAHRKLACCASSQGAASACAGAA